MKKRILSVVILTLLGVGMGFGAITEEVIDIVPWEYDVIERGDYSARMYNEIITNYKIITNVRALDYETRDIYDSYYYDNYDDYRYVRDYRDVYDYQRDRTYNAFYTVQVGAFLKLDNAVNLYKRLSRLGYNVYMVEATVRGRLYTRVRIGFYGYQDDAKSMLRTLKYRGYTGYVIKVNI